MSKPEKSFDRLGLLDALDTLGAAALAHGTRLDLAVYGGSALMLARNFRFATEDVDIAEIGERPAWLDAVVAEIAQTNGWSADWLNEAVAVYLSPLADAPADHLEYGTFPRGGPVGLQVIVPSADYMLALKLKAMRTLDAAKGTKETADIFQLMRVIGIDTTDQAMQVLGPLLSNIRAGQAKQRFLLKHLTPSEEAKTSMRPNTLAEACRRAQAGEAFDIALGEFLQSYYLAKGVEARVPMLAEEPPRFADQRYDALVGGIAEYLFKRWAPFRPPPWIKSRDRYLDRPWWPVGEGDPGLMEYLAWASPPEFKSRNIMTDEAPLRRATQPPVEPLRTGG